MNNKSNNKARNTKIIVLNIIIIVIIDLVITFFLSSDSENIIDKTFTLSTMLAFVGIGLSMFVFLNGYVQNLRKSIIELKVKKDDSKKLLSGLNNYFMEIKEDLYVIYISMIIIFVIEVLNEIPIFTGLKIQIFRLVLDRDSLLFFIKTLAILFALRALCDIFSSIMGINRFGNLISNMAVKLMDKEDES